MFTASLQGSGSPWVDLNLRQLVELFPEATLSTPESTLGELRESIQEIPPSPSAVREKYFEAIFLKYFNPYSQKKTFKPIIIMHHNIFNNPNISITPSAPSPKQPPIASTSRPPWITPVSPPVSIVSVSSEPEKSVSNDKETQKHSKRTAPYQISNRTIKHARLSITKPANARKCNKTTTKSVKLNQIKKNDTVVSNTNVAKSIPSTSNAVIQSTQEVASVQSTNEELQPSNSELNFKDNSSHLDNDKKENGFHRKYCLYNNEYLLHHLNIDNDDTTEKSQDMIELRTINEKFWFKQSLSDELLQNVRLLIQNKTADEEEFESIIKSSSCLQLPKVDCSSSTSTNSKKSPASQNNINSINQPNQVGISKPQKQTIIQQQPSKQTIKSSNITKQSTSTKISSKMQHSTINQTDPKHHVSNNQHNNTSLKHTKATATHIQTSNKQITNSNQLPISSKLVSTTKKVVNIHQNVKPAIVHQSSVKGVKKCIKCKALSKDETCAACRMSSHLKNVTVTRIGTPSTSTVVLPESPIITPSKSIDVPSTSKNAVICEPPLVLLLSSEDEDEDEDEEEEEDSLEPNITKMETKEALKKHTDKLCSNPKLLEDRLWQKDLSVKDYYKIEDCHSVHIGSFKTVPAPSGDMLVCLHGIRMTVKGLEPEPVTIDLQMDNVVKILGYYGEKPLIIIYTNHLAAAGIQYLLNMNEDNKNHFYDPLSKDVTLNKIVWFFNLKRAEIQHLEKLLLKLSKRKYAPLTINQVNTILCSTIQDEEEIRRLEKQRADEEMERINAITILEDRLGERSSVIKINDYRMLNTNEFINDILIEFYLNYWYTHKLSEEDRKRTYVFSTYFYTTLAKSFNASDYPSHYTPSQIRHEKVKKWTKNVDIFKKDFVFIPVNENFHWFMAVVCFPYLSGKVNMKDGTPVNTPDDNAGRYPVPPVESYAPDRIEADPNVEDLWLFDMASPPNLLIKQGINYEIDTAVTKRSRPIQVKRPCILLFDSLSGGVNRARITATLRDWLEQEYTAKYKGKKKDFSPKAIKGALLRLPQQPNYTDCGLFAIHFFKRFFERPIVDYTLPIRHLENWFSVDEVAKNCQKRRELQSIIFARMKVRGSVLPDDVQLPILNFTDPPIKLPQNPHQRNTNPADVQNSTNRINSSNLRPSTSYYQSNPSHELQNHVIQNNSGYHNHAYYENHVYGDSDNDIDSYDDDEVERQFDEDDHYDEGSPENYQEDYNVEQYADLQNQREYFPENTQQIDDDVDSLPNSDDEQIIEYHQQLSNNGNLIVNDHHSGLSNRRSHINIQNISNENHQAFRSNNLDYDDYEIEGDDDGDDGDEEIDDEEEERNFNESNSTTNHNRRKIHFNHRLSN